MHVNDVMHKGVFTVSPETTLKEAAALLVEHRISGLPVVDADGSVVGVISEGDIIRKERGPQAPPKGFRRRKPAVEERTVGDAMTAPAVTIQHWRSVADAAKTMLEEEVKRLPVLRHGELVGIVTRADLVRAFARTDEQIEAEIRDDVLARMLLLPDPAAVEVHVQEGAVTLRGWVEREYEAQVAAAAVARVPGVVSVDSMLHSRERVEA